ncbi:NACHT, LRR and PYD domains-containing protein 14 [Phlyctochytrium planicorne]|nr:NACHT, LRR and PYD domains-containing protein 14 [Phlyctochytrium planicorne]
MTDFWGLLAGIMPTPSPSSSHGNSNTRSTSFPPRFDSLKDSPDASELMQQTIALLQDTIKDRDLQIQSLRKQLDQSVIEKDSLEANEKFLNAALEFINIKTPNPISKADITSQYKLLSSFEERLRKKITELETEIASIRKQIADIERSWQSFQSIEGDNPSHLKAISWTGWPLENRISKHNYHYDYFISYRVSSEFATARELRLRLMKHGKKVFLDQEELKDGEDWRQGFVTGLKRSKIVILLISRGCIERMMRSSTDIDNVLLEWETALCASKLGFCHVVPVYIGTGELDIQNYPKGRPFVEDLDESTLICQQSAFSTLSQVIKLQNRYNHPEPLLGFQDSLIDALVSDELKRFDENHESKKWQRALVTFVIDLAPLETINLNQRSIENVWNGEYLELEHVPADVLPFLRFLIPNNANWKDFRIQDTGSSKEFIKILELILEVKPKAITLKRTGEGLSSKEISSLKELFQASQLESVTFNVKECSLKSDTVMDLANSLQQSSISKLDLSGNEFKSSDIQVLAASLKSYTNLLSLDLSESNIGDDGASSLAELKHLKNLTLRKTGISSSGLAAIFKGLAESCIESFVLESSAEELDSTPVFDDVSTKELSALIRSSNHLLHLELKRWFLRDDTILQLGESLSASHTITVLVLADNALTTKRLNQLSNHLKSMRKLESVDLSGNLIGTSLLDKLTFDDIKKDLNSALENLFSIPSLRTLNLCKNKLHDAGAALLGSHLKNNRNVVNILLDENSVSETGIVELCNIAQEIQYVKKLSLRGTVCSEKVVLQIVEAFQKSDNLQVVFDWSQVEFDYIIPRIWIATPGDERNASCTVKFGEAPKKGLYDQYSKQTTKEISTADISIAKDKVLRALPQILDKTKELLEMNRTLSSILRANDIFEDNVLRLPLLTVNANFQTTAREGADIGFMILSQIREDSSTALPLMDTTIIREISLRLHLATTMDKDKFLANFEDKGADNSADDDVPDVNDDKSVVEFLDPSILYHNSDWIDIHHPAYANVTTLDEAMKPQDFLEGLGSLSVFLVFLSEAILEGIDTDEELFWKAIDTWDYILALFDTDFMVVLPVFLASGGDADSTIFRLQTKLKKAIYNIGALYSARLQEEPNENGFTKAADFMKETFFKLAVSTGMAKASEPLPRLERSIARAYKVVNRIFQLQGITIATLKQVPEAVDKIRQVLKSRVELDFEKRKVFTSNQKQFLVFMTSVLLKNMFDFGEPITDRNVATAKLFLQIPGIANYRFEIGSDEECTSIESSLVEYLKKCSSLESLEINGYWVDSSVRPPKAMDTQLEDADVESLCEMLMSNRTLRSLSLPYHNLTSSQARALAAALPEISSLVQLDLSSCNIAGESVTMLATTLSKLPQLSLLWLRGMSCDIAEAKGFGEYLSNSKVENFTIAGDTNSTARPIEDEALYELIKAVAKSHIKVFAMSERPVGLKSASALASLGLNKSLKTLYLNDCSISSEAAAVIIPGLQNSQMGLLEMMNNQIDDSGASLIARWILATKTLQSINVHGNNISENSKKSILDAVIQNQSLVSFCLDNEDVYPNEVLWKLALNKLDESKSSELLWLRALASGQKELKDKLMKLPDAAEYKKNNWAFLCCMAAYYGDLDLIKDYLKDIGPERFSAFVENATCTLFAMSGGNIEILFYILDNLESPHVNVEDDVPLYYYALAVASNVEMAERIATKTGVAFNFDEAFNDQNGTFFVRKNVTALHTASLFGYHQAVEYILPKMSNVNVVDEYQSTALHAAARGKTDAKLPEILEDQGIRPSLALESNFIGKSKELLSVERSAKRSDHAKVIELLVQAGVDVNAKDIKGRTALDIAVLKKQSDLVKVLESLGGKRAADL